MSELSRAMRDPERFNRIAAGRMPPQRCPLCLALRRDLVSRVLAGWALATAFLGGLGLGLALGVILGRCCA